MMEPTNLGPLKLQNSIIRAATATFYCEPLSGIPTERVYNFYKSLAGSHAGMIIMEHAFVQEEGHADHPQLGIHTDDMIPYHKKMIDMIKAVDPAQIVCCQLAHAGPMSKHPGAMELNTMTEEQIDEVVNCFARAASRAKTAGYDCVEVHSAHFYLLARSVSDHYNKRTDEYSAEKMTLLKRVIAAAKTAGLPTGVKLQNEDFIEGGKGVTPEKFCAMVEKIHRDLDFIELSGGSADGKWIPSRPNQDKFYYRPTVEMLVKHDLLSKCNFIVTGGFENLGDAKVAADLGVTFFGFGRKFLRNDKFLIDGDKKKCIHCNKCFAMREGADIHNPCIFANAEIVKALKEVK